jgi:heptose-I-phosphate ethanolaminephosphotransferase
MKPLKITTKLSGASWLHLFLLGSLILVLSTALGLNRPNDALKSLTWFLLFGTAMIWLDHKLWPRKRRAWNFFGLIFILDLAIQGVVRLFFGATPSPSVIAQALANTNTSESLGFITEQAHSIGLSGLFTVLSFFCLVAFNKFALDGLQSSLSKTTRSKMSLLLLVTASLHFNPSMIRQEPFLRWIVVLIRHQQAQAEIKQIQAMQQSIKASENDWLVHPYNTQNKTVVLIIGESSNRNNWGKYGYSRPTTKPLEDTLSALPGQTVWFDRAESTAAFTLPSLQRAFTPADKKSPELWKTTPDLFMLAQAAGYRMTWLSNQPGSDGWIASLGKNAAQSSFINNGNWRDSSTTDFDLLPELNKILSTEPPAKELIVLHLLGQHFHYQLRCPPNIKPYEGIDDDQVMLTMKSQDRTSGIRQKRNDYDNAVYCGAIMISEALKNITTKRANRDLSVVYFSDHGQEVGHTQNFAGHSESSSNGYDIPLFVWTNQERAQKNALYSQLFALDNLEHLMQGVLEFNSAFYQPNLNPQNSANYPK